MGVTQGMDLLDVIVCVSRQRGDRATWRLSGRLMHRPSAADSREPLRVGERAIPRRGALLDFRGRQQRVPLVTAIEPGRARPSLTSGIYRDVFTGGLKRTPFLSPSYAELWAIRANRDRMHRYVPHSGGAIPTLYLVMTKTLGPPYLSRPRRSYHDKPRSRRFLT
jgi:hypothetical protein